MDFIVDKEPTKETRKPNIEYVTRCSEKMIYKIIRSLLGHFLLIYSSFCFVIAYYENHKVLMIISGFVLIYTWITLAKLLVNLQTLQEVQKR